MLPELREFLASATTPELLDVIEEANQAFDNIGLEGYSDNYLQVLMASDQMDQGEAVSTIVSITDGMLRQILNEHGITVDSATTTDVLSKLVSGVMAIQDYEGVAEIQGIVADDCSTEEMLANLMELVTELHAETYLTVLEFVNPFFISRLKEVIEVCEAATEQPEAEPPVEIMEKTKKLVSFVKFLERPKLDIMEHLSAGLRVGYPMSIYLNALGPDIEQMDPKKAAQELLAIAFISGDAQHTPREAVSERIDNFVSSLERITEIDAHMRDILLRFERYEQA